jgi:hypothetical protein
MSGNIVVEFVKGLFRSRASGAEAWVSAKKYGAVARVKGKVSNKFNQAIDKPMDAAKKKVTGKKNDAAKNDAAKKEKGMGFFSRKKTAPPPDVQAPAYESDEPMKTVALNLDSINQGSREVVGWVVILGGEQKGKDFRLFPGRNVVGTSADCDIVLTDAYLSSKHCAIRYEDEQYSMVDLDSTNGTYVNGKRTSKVELIDNDIIRLGKTELKFKALY